jgi:serine/threonine-protein kinase HipA
MRLCDVLLGDTVVGQLGRVASGQILFRLNEAYKQMPVRPVLGQRFEDDLSRVYAGSREELPPFFANLIPEGPLRELLQHSLSVLDNDDLVLLAAVGHDLPGAVLVHPSKADTNLLDANAAVRYSQEEQSITDVANIFRFSLAGVQMKFSVLNSNEKLLLPMHDQQGNWIVKFDSTVYPCLVENEFATMQWARAAGFNVPECQVRSAAELPEELAQRTATDSKVFLIKRYDRQGQSRIHQEDLAQVAGLRPALKYDQWTYETCARVIGAVCGQDAYDEFIRRLVFMVASGNTDAHLKNWSLLYPDGVNAELTPLYDQVAIIAWPPPEKGMTVGWALKFAGTKNLYRIDEAAFKRLAERSSGDINSVLRVVNQTLDQVADAWQTGNIAALMPLAHTQALRAYWHKSPLLQSRAMAITA